MCNKLLHNLHHFIVPQFRVRMLQNQIQLMKTTPNPIKLVVRGLFSDACNNTLKMADHSVCSVGADSNHLSSPSRTQDVKNTRDKNKHVFTSVLLKHRDGNEVNVVELAIDVDSNAIIEVGFA